MLVVAWRKGKNMRNRLEEFTAERYKPMSMNGAAREPGARASVTLRDDDM